MTVGELIKKLQEVNDNDADVIIYNDAMHPSLDYSYITFESYCPSKQISNSQVRLGFTNPCSY